MARERLDSDAPPATGPRSAWRSAALVVAFQATCLAVATYPAVKHLPDRLLGSPVEPLHQLWVMDQVREGGLGAAGDATKGLTHLLFAALAPVLGNDVLAYNLLWAGGMVLLGSATAALIYRAVPHVACAAFGGMLAMLSTPMLLRSRGFLDTIPLGFLPLFLGTWIALVERPACKRLVAAAVIFGLMSMGTQPLGLYAVPPAALYLGWAVVSHWRAEGRRSAMRMLGAGALGGAGAFAAVALVKEMGLAPWVAAADGGWDRFAASGVPFWSYFLPTTLHYLFAITPVDFYHHAGLDGALADKASYLGVVTLLLVHYGLVHGVRCRRRGYVYAALVLLVLLSCGAAWDLWSWTVPLPAAWLKKGVTIFRGLAVPAHFNVLAAMAAAVLAAAALAHMLDGIAKRRRRVAVFVALSTLAVLDLATNPFPAIRVPARPPAFARLLARDPEARALDIPQFGGPGPVRFEVGDLWRKGRSKAEPLAPAALESSPFRAGALARRAYVEGQQPAPCGLVGNTNFEDYAWLYTRTHHIHYLVLQKWLVPAAGGGLSVKELKARLAHAAIDEDAAVVVYDCERLRPPAQPVLACTGGWDVRLQQAPGRGFTAQGGLQLHVPGPGWNVQIALNARALRHPREVRVLAGETELARWEVGTESDTFLTSPPFTLPTGTHDLRVVCSRDGREPTQVRGREPVRLSLTAVGISSQIDPQVAAKDGRVRK